MLFCTVTSAERIALPEDLDGVELRLDLFQKVDLVELKKFISFAPCPVMLTPRASDHAFLEALFALKPAYIDVGCEIDKSFLERMKRAHPEVKVLGSFHDFEAKERELDALFDAMIHTAFDAYKIALKVDSSLDAMRMLDFTKEKSRDFKLSMIAMGECGEWSRILGPVFGNWIDYTFLGEPIAPGQVSYDSLCNIYHYPKLHAATPLYALIGNPIVKSRGHLFHNALFKGEALYVKIPLKENELSDAMNWFRKVGFQGLSVTMPLKEKIIPFLDALDPEAEQIGAVNTVLNDAGRLVGWNTDAPGAVAAIEEKKNLDGKRVAIIGTGGVAKAIAYAAHQRGAKITILCRELHKGVLLAEKVNGRAVLLDQEHGDYDILINCTPNRLPIESVLDVDIEMDFGKSMFEKQAMLQQEIWSSLCMR